MELLVIITSKKIIYINKALINNSIGKNQIFKHLAHFLIFKNQELIKSFYFSVSLTDDRLEQGNANLQGIAIFVVLNNYELF